MNKFSTIKNTNSNKNFRKRIIYKQTHFHQKNENLIFKKSFKPTRIRIHRAVYSSRGFNKN